MVTANRSNHQLVAILTPQRLNQKLFTWATTELPQPPPQYKKRDAAKAVHRQQHATLRWYVMNPRESSKLIELHAKAVLRQRTQEDANAAACVAVCVP